MGEFTKAQWAEIKASFVLDWRPEQNPPSAVDSALGRALFFEPKLSGNGDIACVTCHAVGPRPWLIDERSENAVSASATGHTRHNTISLVDMVLKEVLPPTTDHRLFTWTGQCNNRPCSSPAIVIDDIALPKAMASPPAHVGDLIRNDPLYSSLYAAAFTGTDDAIIVNNVERSFEAYMRELVSLDSPFDEFVRGDDTAIDEAAKRGFALFIGRGMCSECHRGPALTDFDFHVTGVEQSGAYAPTVDPGRDNTGKFFTAPLRHVAETGPYMHDGSLKTLADVVSFYRWGGAASGYVGTKDARIEPLDIDDNDARDLEAFLRTLTGAPVAAELLQDPRGTP